jgi:putative NADH-flavin reductase
MKIAIVGASGRAGSRITAELARRGHQVTAIARNPDKIERLAGVTAVKGDVLDQAGLAQLWSGHDAAVSSVHFTASDPDRLIGAARDSKVGRYLVVGGAGSLEVAPGVRLVTTPGFPTQYKAEAEKGAAFLNPFCGCKKTSTGPSCRPRPCSSRGSGPASSGSAPTSF